MDRFLSFLEKLQPEAIIDKEKLKYFISKLSIWGHFSITEQAYKSSSIEEKKVCLVDIINGFIKSITGQIIFIYLLFCTAVCCLQFFVCFWY